MKKQAKHVETMKGDIVKLQRDFDKLRQTLIETPMVNKEYEIIVDKLYAAVDIMRQLAEVL